MVDRCGLALVPGQREELRRGRTNLRPGAPLGHRLKLPGAGCDLEDGLPIEAPALGGDLRVHRQAGDLGRAWLNPSA